MHRRRRCAWLTIAACTAAAPAIAADAVEEVATLPGVVVTATRSAIDVAESPAAASLVTRETIDSRNVFRLGDALGGVPGLLVRGSAFGEAFPASGAGAITLRGIPRTPRTLVLLDGAPLNNALSGAVNFSGIAMHDVDHVEVVRGPFSALYGGHAMGGVVQVFSVVPTRREAFVEVGAGGGGLPRQGYAAGYRDRLDNGLGITASAGYRRSDGWEGSDPVVKTPVAGVGRVPVTGAEATRTPDGREAWLVGDKGARPWEQYNASLALRHEPRAGVLLAAGAAWSKYRTGASPPSSLLRDASAGEVFVGDLELFGAGRRVALAESDFLTQTPSMEEEWRAWARGEFELADGTVLRATASWLDHAFRFPQAAATAAFASGPGEFFDQPSWRGDVDVHVRTQATRTVDLTAGASYNRNRIDRASWRAANWRDFGSRTSVTSSGAGTSSTVAAYADAQWYALSWLAVYGGVRYDRFTTEGHTRQFTPPAFEQDSPSRSASQVSPKIAAVASIGHGATARLSYGEGFRAPTLLDLYSRIVAPGVSAGAPVVTEPSPDLAPERVRSVELGVDVPLPARGRAQASLFSQRLTDLIYRQRVSPVLNVLVNAGEAKIDGVELEISQPLIGERLRLHGSATHLFRYDITRNDALPASVGKRLTDVAQSLYSIGLEGRWHGWSGSATWRHVSHAFGSGDDQNRNTVQEVFGSWDRYDVVNLKLARDVAPGVTLSVAVDNVLDADYFQFYRQPGRSVYFEVTTRF